MSTNSIFAFADEGKALEFCGPNDENLRLIEELISAQIHPRGTELVLADDNFELSRKEKNRLFIQELMLHQKQGLQISAENIRILHDAVQKSGSGGKLRDVHIAVPGGFSRVYPKSLNQGQLIQSLQESELVFAVGPAGTGKTYLAIAHALSEVLSKRKKRLVLTRPVVEAGESLGFLPGDLSQKLNPYLKPLYDAMDAIVPAELVARMEESRIIEIAPLAYMRGRSLRDAYIILDEAQNTTREQMKMFLTRLGEGTQAVITGDVTQIDLPSRQTSGLVHATRVLKDIPEIKFHYFSNEDVVRSNLVRKIVNAYAKFEGQGDGKTGAAT